MIADNSQGVIILYSNYGIFMTLLTIYDCSDQTHNIFKFIYLC